MHHTNKNDTFFAHCFNIPEEGYLRTQQALQAMADTIPDSLDGRDVVRFKVRADQIEHVAQAGTFYTPSVQELRDEVANLVKKVSGLLARQGPRVVCVHDVADSYQLHANVDLSGGVFQAASQFNCLEMISPGVSPERGITCYASDHTQGPACARAAAYGTAQRNYLALVPGSKELGQNAKHQINCIYDIGRLLQSVAPDLGESPWVFQNGYIESTSAKLHAVNSVLEANQREVVSRLRIGVQRDTQVTTNLNVRTLRQSLQQALVTQVYCSAIPVGYSKCKPQDWAPLAKLVLEGTYEATLLVTVLANLRKLLLTKPSQGAFHPVPCLLTSVGGGVFGNDHDWIVHAANRAFTLVAELNLPFSVVVHWTHFAKYNELVRKHLIAEIV